MKKSNFKINGIPAVVYGEKSEKVYLFIHGKSGCKEEAEDFANFVCPNGWQVLGIDLPEHGERKAEKNSFNPWCVVPELHTVMTHIHENWAKVSLRANSIGAWFCMLSYSEEEFENCLFVSPILDMKKLITNMMMWANVSENDLRIKKIIETDFGETLSWQYFEYVRQNTIKKWNCPTSVLYAENDNLTDRETVKDFCNRFGCNLSIMKNGEHWFHTPEQMEVLHEWTNSQI